ncbi:MAG: hypothetical protein ACYSPI_01770 [Planctomycetota bacterium]|jgi:hypothetical protein
MRKKKLFKVILSSIVGLLLTFLIIDTFFPQVWWHLKYSKFFRNASRVEIYSYKTEQRIIIENKQDIKRLWRAMDVWDFEQTGYPDDVSFAYIAYDIDIENEHIELGFPFYIHESGVTLWGMPPDRDRYYNMPDLRDTVIDLCKKYNIEIDMNTSNEAGIETTDFAD